jgi:hypothetical protein
MKAYRANRSFGAMQEGEYVQFEDGDPVLETLLGTGYLDVVDDGSSVRSQEKFGTPTVSQDVHVTTSSDPSVIIGSGNPADDVVTISTAPAVPDGPAPAAP